MGKHIKYTKETRKNTVEMYLNGISTLNYGEIRYKG